LDSGEDAAPGVGGADVTGTGERGPTGAGADRTHTPGALPACNHSIKLLKNFFSSYWYYLLGL